LNETLHDPPAIQQGNHSIRQVFTQSGSDSDIATYLPDVRFTPQEQTSRDHCGMSVSCH
jgi:hypothetical protein